MLSYLFEATICWTTFYLIYYLLLQKETFFTINRQYLCGTLLLGGLIPLLRFIDFNLESSHELLEPIYTGIYVVENSLEATIVVPASSSWIFIDTIIVLYISGIVFFSSRFFVRNVANVSFR